MQKIKLRPEIFYDDNVWIEEWVKRWKQKLKLQRCKRCLYDETTPGIKFDVDGICNYCKIHDELIQKYPGGEAGFKQLKELVDYIKKKQRKKPYDIVIGISGGTDSSYLVYFSKQELKLRPIAVHFDNTYDSDIAVQNIRNILNSLEVPLYTYVVDNEEFDNIYKAFLKSGVPDTDTPTDVALAATLRIAAVKYRTKFIFEAHNFRNEGISPIGWAYIDGKYVESVYKTFGEKPTRFKSFPNLWFWSQIKWMIIDHLKFIRPLWYIDYSKENAKKLLSNFGWKYYGGHHLENRTTVLYHTYIMPRRFDMDTRMLELCAKIRMGELSREEGLKIISQPIMADMENVEYIKKRLGFSDEEWIKIMTQPYRSYKDFKTYRPLFKKLRWFFYIMMKLNLIPESFYIKYTS